MYKTYTLAILMFAALCLTGCQQTPEETYVISKSDNTLEEIIDISLAEDQHMDVPEKIFDIIYEKDGAYSIAVEASPEEPNTTEFPVVSIVPRRFPQALVDKTVKHFFQNQTFYAAQTIKSKEQLSQEMQRLAEDMETMEIGSDDYEAAASIMNDLKKEYPNAPDTVTAEIVEPVLQIDEETSYELLSAYADMGYRQFSWLNVINVVDDSFWNILTVHLDRDRLYLSSTDAKTRMDTTQFTKDSALELANETLAALGIDGFAPVAIEEAYAEQSNEYGYAVHYRHSVNGICVADSTILDFSGERIPLSAQWGSDTIDIRVGKSGITAFEWEEYGEIIGNRSSNVELLPFSKTYEIAKQQLKNKYAWIETTDIDYHQKIYVDRIVLEYRCVAQKDSRDTFLLVPAWSFYGDILCEYPDGTSALMYEGRTDICHLVLNAIDGSVISCIA